MITIKSKVAMSLIHAVVRDSMYRDPRKVQLFYDTVAIHLAYPNTTRDEILSLLHIFKQFITLVRFFISFINAIIILIINNNNE